MVSVSIMYSRGQHREILKHMVEFTSNQVVLVSRHPTPHKVRFNRFSTTDCFDKDFFLTITDAVAQLLAAHCNACRLHLPSPNLPKRKSTIK